MFSPPGSGRGLLGPPVEDPAESGSARGAPPGCCRVPGQLPGPGQVHPYGVSPLPPQHRGPLSGSDLDLLPPQHRGPLSGSDLVLYPLQHGAVVLI